MNKRKFFLMFFFCLAMIALAGCGYDSKVFLKDSRMSCAKVRVAVLPFSDASGQPGSGVVVADSITNELMQVRNWSMVERSQISKIMSEKSLDATGLTTADINRIAQLTNTDYIIVGSISQYHYGRKALIVAQTKLSFQGRIVDVKTGDIAGTFSYDVETGKYAWCGCCICGWYYLPVLLFTDENITNDVRIAATRISNSIISQIEKNADRDCRRQ